MPDSMIVEVVDEFTANVRQILEPMIDLIDQSNTAQGYDTERRNSLWSYLWRCEDWRLAAIQQLVDDGATIWIKGEPLTGKPLGARLRQIMLTYGQANAAREWFRMAALLYEMELQEDQRLLLGEVTFDHYLDQNRPGGLTANRASAMRAWMREVVPMLQKNEIDPYQLVDMLEPAAMERFVPLVRAARGDRGERRGRKSIIESAGDPRLALVLVDYVLDRQLRTVDDFEKLRHHPAIVKASPIMDMLQTAQIDPVQAYTDLGLDRVDILAHRLSQGQLGDNPQQAVTDLIITAKTYSADQVRALQISRPGNELDEPLADEVMDEDRDLIVESTGDMYRPEPVQPWSTAAWIAFERSGGKCYRRDQHGQPVRVSFYRSDLPRPDEVM
jgi:hypothetical protein